MKPPAIASLLALLILAGSTSHAQTQPAWDTSGNNLLEGAYNFRHVIYLTGDDSGNLSRAVALWGTIEFDAKGSYTLRATVLDSRDGTQQQSFTRSGDYRIAASGYGFLTSPIINGRSLYCVISRGIILASSTDAATNDLFIASPATTRDNTFRGNYWTAEMNVPSLTISNARDALFRLAFDGQGRLGAVAAEGYIGGAGGRVTQSVPNVTYAFTGASGRITYGGAAGNRTLLSGDRVVYTSPDGNFIFGGSTTGWDIFAGVRQFDGAAPSDLLSGLYYQAGADIGFVRDRATMHSYYGAFHASAGIQINHQRLLSGFDDLPYDFSFSDTYEVARDASYEDYLGFRNIVGADGNIRIGFGQEATLGLSVAVKAPELSGTGVFLNPAGILNAASRTPFTIGLAPGEMIELSGTGLANETLEDTTFPTMLGGVQVLINGKPAPVRDVSPRRITAIVPFDLPDLIARIQVVKNGEESNAVTMFTNTTAAGVFMKPKGSALYADAIHSDTSSVTAESPVRPGEIISLFVTGLGEVKDPIKEGTVAPIEKRIGAKADVRAFVDGKEAKVSFAGLAPGVIGLYKLDLEVPSGTLAGDQYVDVSGPDSYTSIAQLPVAGMSGRFPSSWGGLEPVRGPRLRGRHPEIVPLLHPQRRRP